MSIVPRNDFVRKYFNKAERTISCTEGEEREKKIYQMPCERDCNKLLKRNGIRTVENNQRRDEERN